MLFKESVESQSNLKKWDQLSWAAIFMGEESLFAFLTLFFTLLQALTLSLSLNSCQKGEWTSLFMQVLQRFKR